jgi:MFS family permease
MVSPCASIDTYTVYVNCFSFDLTATTTTTKCIFSITCTSLHSVSNYIAENSPPSLRGTLTGFIEIFITIGIIYGYAIGQWLTYEFPYDFPWKYTFKFATLFGIIMFFGMLSLPESPRWLVSAGRPLYEALEVCV